MASTRTCESCHKPMSSAAGVCPHCGARQSHLGPVASPTDASLAAPVRTTYSAEEKQALLATSLINAPVEGTGPSLFRVLLLPHPMTSGVTRALDVALTVAAAPLMLAGTIGMLVFGRRRAFAFITQHLRGNAELTATLIASVTGVVGMLLLQPHDTSVVDALVLAGAGVLALGLRLLLRLAAEAPGR